MKTFRNAKGIGVGIAGIVEPAPIIEPDGFGNKRVAFPTANGISEPGLRRFGRKAAAVGENLPVMIELLIEEHNDVACLDNLERKIPHQHPIRNAVRYAAFQGFASAKRTRPLITQGSRPGLERSTTDIRSNVLQISTVGRSP